MVQSGRKGQNEWWSHRFLCPVLSKPSWTLKDTYSYYFSILGSYGNRLETADKSKNKVIWRQTTFYLLMNNEGTIPPLPKSTASFASPVTIRDITLLQAIHKPSCTILFLVVSKQ